MEEAAGQCIGTPVVDVLVTIQLKFQQSVALENVTVPQIQFIELATPVASQRRVPTVQTVLKIGDSAGAVLG